MKLVRHTRNQDIIDEKLKKWAIRGLLILLAISALAYHNTQRDMVEMSGGEISYGGSGSNQEVYMEKDGVIQTLPGFFEVTAEMLDRTESFFSSMGEKKLESKRLPPIDLSSSKKVG